MSSEEEISVVSVASAVTPEPIAQAMYSEEEFEDEEPEEPEEDSDEAPEPDLVDELMDKNTELEDRIQELKEQCEEEKKPMVMLGALVHHLLNRNGDLADKLRVTG